MRSSLAGQGWSGGRLALEQLGDLGPVTLAPPAQPQRRETVRPRRCRRRSPSSSARRNATLRSAQPCRRQPRLARRQPRRATAAHRRWRARQIALSTSFAARPASVSRIEIGRAAYACRRRQRSRRRPAISHAGAQARSSAAEVRTAPSNAQLRQIASAPAPGPAPAGFIEAQRLVEASPSASRQSNPTPDGSPRRSRRASRRPRAAPRAERDPPRRLPSPPPAQQALRGRAAASQ